MKLRVNNTDFNRVFAQLSEEYRIIAPVRKPFRGTMSDTDAIRYEEVKTIEEIEFKDKAQFSAKEVMQTHHTSIILLYRRRI